MSAPKHIPLRDGAPLGPCYVHRDGKLVRGKLVRYDGHTGLATVMVGYREYRVPIWECSRIVENANMSAHDFRRLVSDLKGGVRNPGTRPAARSAAAPPPKPPRAPADSPSPRPQTAGASSTDQAARGCPASAANGSSEPGRGARCLVVGCENETDGGLMCSSCREKLV